MSSKNVCRTCLANNNRMHDLKNTYLQETFEKLTSIKLSTEDGRICFICYSQLQRCRRFLDMSQKADKLFRLAVTERIQMIPDSVTTLRASNNFIMTPVDCMSFPERTFETLVTIKVEPKDIKEEVVEFDNSSLFESVKIEGSPIADDFIKRVCEQKSPVHIKMSDVGSHACNSCNKTYQTQRSLRRHISKVHETFTLFECKKYDKKFIQLDSLKCHTATHGDKELYACDFCERTFTIKVKLKNHIRSHTKPFSCPSCDKAFSELSSLKKHVASHSKNKPYICGTCNKSFTHKTFLVVHLRTHTGERPYACNLCDKTFAQIGHAISHKRTHELPLLKIPKQKQYSCSLCDKSFVEKSWLNRHKKTHTGIRPYTCEVCNKMFATRDTVKTHMRRHTGEKPYTCMKCGNAFSTSGNMRKHMQTHEKSNK